MEQFIEFLEDTITEKEDSLNEITSKEFKQKTTRLKTIARKGGKKLASRKVGGSKGGPQKIRARKKILGGKLVRNTQKQSTFRKMQKKKSKTLRKSGIQAKLQKGRRLNRTRNLGAKRIRAAITSKLRRKAGLR